MDKVRKASITSLLRLSYSFDASEAQLRELTTLHDTARLAAAAASGGRGGVLLVPHAARGKQKLA